MHGSREGASNGHRTTASYLMVNYYYDNTLGSTVFVNDQSGTNWIATSMSGASQTWFTFKLTFEQSTSVYTAYVDDVFQDRFTVVRNTQRFLSCKNLLFMSPDVDLKYRNLYLKEL